MVAKRSFYGGPLHGQTMSVESGTPIVRCVERPTSGYAYDAPSSPPKADNLKSHDYHLRVANLGDSELVEFYLHEDCDHLDFADEASKHGLV